MGITKTELLSLACTDEQLLEVLSKSNLDHVKDAPAYRVLVAAYKHIDRQRWVGEVVAGILGADLEELGRFGGFAHPEHIPQEGNISGLDGWSYYFHGMGCRLTHIDGTEVDVDFPDGRCDVIDSYFFGNYLSSIPSPTILESRLIFTGSLSDAWMSELPKLKELGYLRGGHTFELTSEGLSLANDKVTLWDILETLDNPFAKAHAAVILGELQLAKEYLKPSTKSFQYLLPRLVQLQQERFELLMLSLRGKNVSESQDLLKSAASISKEHAKKVVDFLLEEMKYDSTMFIALDLIKELGPESYCESLEKLLGHAWREEPSRPALRIQAATLLLASHTAETLPPKLRSKIIKAVTKKQGRMGDDAARVLYLLDRTSGLQLLKSCLDSEIPIVRKAAAATLAVIDTSESKSILENHGALVSITMLAILNGDEIAQIIPLGNKIEIEGRKFRTYSFDEVEVASMESWLRHQYEDIKKEYVPQLEKWCKAPKLS